MLIYLDFYSFCVLGVKLSLSGSFSILKFFIVAFISGLPFSNLI
ncbi:hypothetical protein CAXC1_180003 [Candidatus Xenohaliotis californiensis]|uniref:Uncharacterized protein n=1 Tax=Candidatus Xenohaliotis californiensis TaxID=84677 RepID=A0ABM9N873_9RICK|nr:hypothetical protein CAXC1_180003 [Candidatus Xenohaliotis californiensis]